MSQRRLDPRIRLRHIVCFLEVARLSSVGGAARALNISQPAVSKTIHELEALLGGKLFERGRRLLVLTALGEVFQRHAATSLSALGEGIEAARGGEAGATLRIGALPTVSARILPAAVEAFTAGGGGAHTRIVTGPNEYLLALLRGGEVDFVIGRMADPEAVAGLAFEHLYSERVVMAVRPGHPLLSAPRFDFPAIARYQTLMPTPDSVIRRLVERLLLAHGVGGLRDEVETVSSAFGRAYVRRTDAIWIISEGVVANDVAEGQLALLPVDTGETLGPVGFTTRAGAAPAPAAARLMEAVRAVAARLTIL